MNEFLNTGLGKALVVVGVVFLGAVTLTELQSLRYIGAGIQPTNVISVSGYGEVYMAPNIATFSFSVVSEKPTVKAAQNDATAKINSVTEYLKGAGVENKDIQTSNYQVYPQYDYTQGVCTQYSCPPSKQVLRGYEVRQTTTVKVRDTDKAGDLLAGVGGKGATEVSGLEFTFDDPQATETQARGKAIADAKEKAEELARQLGVRIVRVVSFSENSGGHPMPYKMEAYGRGGADTAVAQVAPAISVGENKVTSNVSVTYEIR